MREIYLDNSATTPLCDAAKEKLNSLIDCYGNPSSLHTIGKNAEHELDEAREIILSCLSVPGQINRKQNLIFTSSGTEANNLAITGVVCSKERNKGKHIITTATEHDSVLKTTEHLSKSGYKVSYINSPKGKLDIEQLKNSVTKDTLIVSAMLVNNETGSVNNINEIADIVHEINPETLIHCDAVQGFLKIPYSYYSKADLVTISAHKLNALKGTGALFVKPEVLKLRALSPIIFGGGQEFGFRSGTQNTLGIAVFGASVKYHKENNYSITKNYGELYSYISEKITSLADLDVRINKPESDIIAHHIVNIYVRGIKSETLLHSLSSEGIYVSSGSACASNTNSKSHVLKNYGLSDSEIDSSIRVSFGIQNTKEDINCFISALKESINKLRRK